MARRDALGPVCRRGGNGVRIKLTDSKYAWFGAVRNAAWLYAVHPSNRLLNVDGSLTPL